MGLDIGERRIGVAVADTNANIAFPLRVMDARDVCNASRDWRRVLEDNEPELLVFGFPKTLSGAAGKQASRVREIAESIARQAGLPLEFVDERLSSAEAKRYLRERGLSEKDMRGKVDSIAASLILESWIERRRNEEMEV